MGQDVRILELQSGDDPLKRLDKEISALVPETAALSRSRVTTLIRDGYLRDRSGRVLNDPSARTDARRHYRLEIPQAVDGVALPEAIPLHVLFEDDDLIVIEKPAGMVVHPAPGAWTGTLVSALLHHCGESLSGIGGEKRPGIVHRLDKDTTGVMVAAKTDRAHHGLAEQFAAHSVERRYRALCWGAAEIDAPRLRGVDGVDVDRSGAEGPAIRIATNLDRHRSDRKKMAVAETGRHAVTRIFPLTAFGGVASEGGCVLETGRTHQIRVHATHIGHGLIGDPVYGRARDLPKSVGMATRKAVSSFKRQALHAETLGFVHPATGKMLRFFSDLPEDMQVLRQHLLKI